MTPTRMFVFLLLACAAGCSTKPGPSADAPVDSTAKADPWPAAAAILRRQPDLGGARQVVSLLNADLGEATNAETPKPMSAESAKALGERLRLAPDELADATGTLYTNLDAAHLAECLAIRDAIRSLDFGDLPDDRKLRGVFEWVCRQVYLRQALVHTPAGPALSPTIPPQFVLLRGYGSGLDRALLFLAAIQQLGWDGCLIGPPGQETAVSIGVENNKATKGPFWAVGCRLPNGTITLFDPWRGEPFPGTLAELTANPILLKPWLDDRVRPWDGSIDSVKAATIYLAVPYVAATERMKLLERKIGGEVGVKPSIDLESIAKRFGAKAIIWSAPANVDRYGPTRVLPSFLPIDEGGTDASPTRELRLYEQLTKLAPIPIEQFEPPTEVSNNDFRNFLKAFFLKRYSELVLDPNPRERIGRGQFHEVVRTLVERERAVGKVRERARRHAAPADAIKEWIGRANELYEKQSIARLPQNQANLPAAQADIEQFWGGSAAVIPVVEERSILPICAADLSYHLAICKQEQAERASIRLRRTAGAGHAAALTGAKDAWAIAKDAWGRHLAANDLLARPNPERTAQAQRLAARTARLAADPAAE